MKKIMGIDYGDARTGIAISDESRFLATPVGTVTQRNKDRLLEEVAALAVKHGAAQIVVGLPRNMDGSKGESAIIAETFADVAATVCDHLNVEWNVGKSMK